MDNMDGWKENQNGVSIAKRALYSQEAIKEVWLVHTSQAWMESDLLSWSSHLPETPDSLFTYQTPYSKNTDDSLLIGPLP